MNNDPMRPISIEMLKEIVAASLGVTPTEITNELSLDEAPSWDSIAHIAIFTELESRLDQTFTANQIMETRDFEALCTLVGLAPSEAVDD